MMSYGNYRFCITSPSATYVTLTLHTAFMLVFYCCLRAKSHWGKCAAGRGDQRLMSLSYTGFAASDGNLAERLGR